MVQIEESSVPVGAQSSNSNSDADTAATHHYVNEKPAGLTNRNNGGGPIYPGSSGPGAGANYSSSETEHDALIEDTLYPPDSFLNRIYWADLPFSQRVSFVTHEQNKEAMRELRLIGRMARAYPLSPLSAYFSRYVSNGMGLFVEGYTLFSIGTLSPLFKDVWPQCWKTYKVCTKQWVQAVDYLEIVGIICGQFMVGIEGDFIGRKFGLVQDALVMLLGTIMLTSMWGTSLNGWIICYALSLYIYGVGVGGEYPMTSTRSLEVQGFGKEALAQDRLHRGRNVSLAFLMQGWGQLFNQVILILLLLIFNGSGGNPPYDKTAVQWTFRLQFAFVGLVTLWLVYYRLYYVKDADAVLRRAQKRSGAVSAYSKESLSMAMHFYWHRLIGTAGAWFCNDFFFYGNKIFAGVFIGIIHPGGSVMTTWLYNLINIGVSLVGYYCAAIFIDNKFYGRQRMQSVGFLMDFILFIVGAAAYPVLVKQGSGVKAFEFIYFFSSFWNQFGPNSTTFLLAAEVFPTQVRSSAHGFSAAIGKLGALAPAILYNYVGNRTKFWVVSWFGLIGFVLSIIFVPDTTGLDLREQERYWEYLRSGRQAEYHGIAIHPRHLSWFENRILRRSRFYDPELDRQARLRELREAYETHSRRTFSESGGSSDDIPIGGGGSDEKKAGGAGADGSKHHIGADDSDLVDDSVIKYFEALKRQGRYNTAVSPAL